jgi:mycothiol system anti-sigma-R factor
MSDQPTHQLNCAETLERLTPYLDRELDPAEREAVQEHLDACGDCANLFRFEDAMLSFLGDRLLRTRAPGGLRARIAKLCRSPR